jgi:hypothetical protein
MKHSLLFIAIALTSPAVAADRSFTVTDFDRVRVDGPFSVKLDTGRGASVRASGSPDALERVSVQVQGRTLIIRPNRNAWGGWQGKEVPAASLRITTPQLTSAILGGSGTIAISRMKGHRLNAYVDGSGTMAIAAAESDRVDASLLGSGTLKIVGKAAQGNLLSTGSGELDASGLATQDLTLTSRTSGNITAAALRTAKITATGSGNVMIKGSPACTVNRVGSGDV